MLVTSPPPTVDSLTDRELVARYVSLHDEIAFAALVRRHSSLVLGICHRVLGHRQDVEDAFQATFLVLARDAHRVRKRESLASWLHGVAYRTSLRATESRHRRIRLLKDVTMIEDTTLADVEHRHQRQLLDEELEALPEKYRDPLILHYLEGQTAQQVAQSLKLSTSTVEGRLKRGRKELHLRLLRRGLGLSIAVAALSVTPQLVTAAEAPALVGSTIHAGLSYTAGDPAGPLFTHEAARLATQETLAMTLTTTTATVTALLLIPIAVGISNHETPSAITSGEPTSQIVTAVGQESKSTPVLLAQVEESLDVETTESERAVRSGRPQATDSTALNDKLQSETKLEFTETPLSEVLRHIADSHGLNIVIDNGSLGDVGVDLDTPISMNVEGIRLASALSVLLKPLKLGYVVDHKEDVVKIASQASIDQQNAESATIKLNVVERDGKSEITAEAGSNSLVLITSKLRLQSPAMKPVTEDGERRFWHFKEQPENAQRIEQELKTETEFEFVDTPLSEAIDYIAQNHGITILIKEELLTDVGVPTDEPVNLIISGVTLESALNIILRPLQLDYITQDEVMMITTAEEAEQNLETRVYDLPNTQMSPPELAELVGTSTQGTWKLTEDGEGTMTHIKDGLVIRQTQRMHREIEALFEQLEQHAAAEREEPTSQTFESGSN